MAIVITVVVVAIVVVVVSVSITVVIIVNIFVGIVVTVVVAIVVAIISIVVVVVVIIVGIFVTIVVVAIVIVVVSIILVVVIIVFVIVKLQGDKGAVLLEVFSEKYRRIQTGKKYQVQLQAMEDEKNKMALLLQVIHYLRQHSSRFLLIKEFRSETEDNEKRGNDFF